jgi:hypothetical protein
MGASVSSLSQLQYAAALTDVPVEALTSSLDHFHEILTRAEVGSGRAGKALAAMGIDAKKLLALPFEQQLSAVAEKISQIENPAKRAGLEMILFGEAGAKLDPLLRQGATGIARLTAEADAAGVTIDGGMTLKLKEAHEAMVKADAVWSHASMTLGVALAPAIEGAASLLDKLAGSISKAAAGWNVIVNGPAGDQASLYEELNKKLGERQALLIEIAKLEEGGWRNWGGNANYLASQKQEEAAVQARIDQLNAQLLAMDKQPKAATDNTPPDIAKPPDLGVTVDATKIYVDKMKSLQDEFNRNTQTSVEQELASYDTERAQLDDLQATGIINQEEYAKRLAGILDKYLPGVEATGKMVKTQVKQQTDEMQELGEKAAQSLQGAFAQFLFDPFKGGAKKMALDFLQALHRMAADAAAADLFKALFGEGTGKTGKTGSGLGAMFGTLLGGGGAKPTGGNGVEGGLMGLASKGISTWLTGLFGGAGSAGAASASSGVGAMIPAIAGMAADGGAMGAGDTFLVGEQGPELFTASSHGNITPNSQLGNDGGGGDTHVHMGDTHIDASGGDADKLMTVLPPILAAHQAKTKADLLNAFRRNGLAAPARA